MSYVTKKAIKNLEPPIWQLKSLYSGSAEQLKTQVVDILKRTQIFQAKYQQINAINNNDLLDIIKEYEKILIDSHRFMIFVQLLYYQDLTDEQSVQLYQKITELMTHIAQHLVFFEQRIAKLSPKILEKNQNKLGVYKRWIQLKQKFLPHFLDVNTEKILLSKDLVAEKAWIDLYDKIFSSLSIKYQNQVLNYEMARHKLSDPQRKTRQKIATLLSQAMQQQNLPLIEIINAVILNKKIEDQHRQYSTPLSQQNMNNDIQGEDLENLVNAVKKNYKIAHRYYAIKAKLLGLKKLRYYDINAPIPLTKELVIPWPQAQKIVIESYESFSTKFANIGQKFFQNQWIDAQVRPHKASGAFCCHGTPDTNPYILMNYQNRIRDVMTLSHELGHGIHFILAQEQPYLLQNTPLVISETASIFSEMLTFQHLLHITKDMDLQRYLLATKIEDKISTVMRQIAFHLFELTLHTRSQENRLSYEDICQIWLKIQQESLGPAVELTDEYMHYWTGILHFIHFPFYVYSYAFGDCLVNNIYNKYTKTVDNTQKKTEFVDQYIQMLQLGNSQNYQKLLKIFDLDTKNNNFWQNGIDFIARLVEKLEKII